MIHDLKSNNNKIVSKKHLGEYNISRIVFPRFLDKKPGNMTGHLSIMEKSQELWLEDHFPDEWRSVSWNQSCIRFIPLASISRFLLI